MKCFEQLKQNSIKLDNERKNNNLEIVLFFSLLLQIIIVCKLLKKQNIKNKRIEKRNKIQLFGIPNFDVKSLRGVEKGMKD